MATLVTEKPITMNQPFLRVLSFFLLLCCLTVFSSCKKSTYQRRLKGTWNMDLLENKTWHNGACGVEAGQMVSETIVQNAGTFIFSGNETHEDYEGTHYSGSWKYDYEVELLGNTYQVTDEQSFTYHVWKETEGEWNVSIENADMFIYETYPLEELERKSWTFQTEDDGDCYDSSLKMVLSK